MGFAHPALNNSGKCKVKLNAKQQRVKDEHDIWLRSRGLHPDQLAAKKQKPTIWATAEKSTSRQTHKTSNTVGNGYAKEPKIYTGKNLLGICVMHKSCLVPVFNKEDAIAIASMRR